MKKKKNNNKCNDKDDDDDDDDEEDDSWLYESSGIISSSRRTTNAGAVTATMTTSTTTTTTITITEPSESSSSSSLEPNRSESRGQSSTSSTTTTTTRKVVSHNHLITQSNTNENNNDHNNNINNNNTKQHEHEVIDGKQQQQQQQQSLLSNPIAHNAYDEATKIMDTVMTLYEPDFKQYFLLSSSSSSSSSTMTTTKTTTTTTRTTDVTTNDTAILSSSELPFYNILKWYVKYPSTSSYNGTKKRRRRQTIHTVQPPTTSQSSVSTVGGGGAAWEDTVEKPIIPSSSKLLLLPVERPLPKQAYPCYIVTDPTKYPVGIDMKSTSSTKHGRSSSNNIVVVRFLGYNNTSWGQYLAVSEKSLLPFNYSNPGTYEWCPKLTKIFNQTIMQQKYFQDNRSYNLQIETLVVQIFLQSLQQRYYQIHQHNKEQQKKFLPDTSFDNDDNNDGNEVNSNNEPTQQDTTKNSNASTTKTTFHQNQDPTILSQQSGTISIDNNTDVGTTVLSKEETFITTLVASSPVITADETKISNRTVTTSTKSIITNPQFATPVSVRRSLRSRMAVSAPPKQPPQPPNQQQQQNQKQVSVLRAGDIIQYHAPNQIVSRNTLRIAAIINCYPNKKKTNDIVIETSLQDYLTMDDEIRIVKRYLNGTLKDVLSCGSGGSNVVSMKSSLSSSSSMLFRPIQCFTLKSEYNGKQFDHVGITKQQALQKSYSQLVEIQNNNIENSSAAP